MKRNPDASLQLHNNINNIKSKMKIVPLLICLFITPAALLAQDEGTEQAAAPAAATSAISLSVQYGKPGQGGSAQVFNINNGDTTFLPLGQANVDQPPALTPQEVQQQNAYKAQLGKISTDIANKVSQIQAKQKQIDQELYIVQRAPLENEKRQLNLDLYSLEQRRNQIQSEHTAKEAQKPTVAKPNLPPTETKGITIKPEVNNNKVIISVSGQGEDATQTNIQTNLDEWVQVYGSESGSSQEIWVKVSAAGGGAQPAGGQ